MHRQLFDSTPPKFRASPSQKSCLVLLLLVLGESTTKHLFHLFDFVLSLINHNSNGFAMLFADRDVEGRVSTDLRLKWTTFRGVGRGCSIDHGFIKVMIGEVLI